MRYISGLLFFAALPCWAQPCEVSSSVKSELELAHANADALKSLRNKFPQDYFVHRAYQDANVDRGVFSAYVQGEYRAMYDLHPDDPLYITLHARALTGTKTPDALKLLDTTLAAHPDYAYAHIKLAEIYTSTVFRDDAKMRVHLLAYRKACPAAITAYTTASRLDDLDFVKDSAAGLRTILQQRTDNDAVAAYNTLWSMEFKAVPLSAQDQVRQRVRTDVAKLRALYTGDNAPLVSALLQGYKMLGDAEGAKWAEALIPAGHSGSSPAQEAISKWRMANQSKMMANFQDFQALLAKQADEWIQQWPDDPQPRSEKFQAIRNQRDMPQEDVVKAAQEWLRVYQAHPGTASPYNSVAQYYASKNIHYDELPGLLEKALGDIKEMPLLTLSDLNPVSSTMRIMGQISKWSTWSSAASTYVKLKQYDKAKDLLAKLYPSLQENKPPAAASAMEKQQIGMQENIYWQTKAEIARAEEHKLDALMFQKNAYLTNAFPNISGAADFRLTAVKTAWKELNGTDEGFDAFMYPAGSAPKAPTAAESAKQPATPSVADVAGRWTAMEKPLPDFQFSDAEGKTWKLADFKGKVTLINLWATWCGPCRAELPYLQKVYNKVRERKDLQIVTFNTDDSRGLILPFMAENKYTFPVMPAIDYVHKIVPELSIPRNWIIDADGVLRSEIVGFGVGDDKWVDDMVAAMEKARK